MCSLLDRLDCLNTSPINRSHSRFIYLVIHAKVPFVNGCYKMLQLTYVLSFDA